MQQILQQVNNEHLPRPEHMAAESDREDETPLYQLDDDEVSPGPSLFSEEELRQAEEALPLSDTPEKSPLKLMAEVMLNPADGWKKFHRARLSPWKVMTGALVPTSCLAGLSQLANFFYDSRQTTRDVLAHVVSETVSFLLGYFVVLFLIGMVLPRRLKDVLLSDKGKGYILLNLSSLALFLSLVELLPMLEPVLVFLPLWTIYMVWRGLKPLHIANGDDGLASTLVGILIVGTPFGMSWLIGKMLGL